MQPSAANKPETPFWAWCVLPLLLGAWLRLRNIGGPEAFVDEGANILSSLDMRVRGVFEPIAQGRPGLIWLFAPAGWVPRHALIAARAMSAMAGLTTMITLGWILNQLAGRTSALCGMLIWAVIPLAVFHERLALQDPFVAALLSLSMGLAIAGSLKSGHRFNWLWFVAAGFLLGVAFLQKISAALALPWLAIIYLAVRHHASRPLIDRHIALIAMGALLAVASLGSEVLLLGTKLENYEALSFTRHGDFGSAFFARLEIWISYYSDYGRWPLLFVTIAAAVLASVTKNFLALASATGWLVAFIVTTVFYNNTYARYVLPDQVPLVLFLAVSTGSLLKMELRKRLTIILLVTLSLARWACISWQIGTDPLQAAIPQKEIAQYYTGPWSGHGLDGVKRFLKKYADYHQLTCVVLVHRFSRPGCYGLMLAELADPHLEVMPYFVYWPGELTVARPILRRMATERPLAFFILYEGSLYPPPHAWLDLPAAPTSRVYEAEPEGKEGFSLYQITP